VRSAHGNSFDHLVGAGDERRWDFEAERQQHLQIDKSRPGRIESR
jgi:hypothetical protein